MSTIRFLLLEDNPLDVEAIQAMLTDGGIDYELLGVDTRADFVAALETKAFDLILAAYTLHGFDGISALEIARNLCPETPFIFVSASLGEELAIETLKQGATDYILKQRLERLVPAVKRALQEAQERRRSQRAEAARSRNEARLRAVAAHLPHGAAFILDRDLRYLLAEGNALEGAGMTSGDLVGKTIWDALDSEIATRYEPYFRQALDGESFSLEHCSHERHYISHGTPLRDERGEVDAVLAVSYDITERKRAELNAEFLATVSQVLVRANSKGEIVQTVGEQLHRYLQVSVCVFGEINERSDEVAINYDWHQDDRPSLTGVYSLPEFVTDEFLQIAKAGEPIVVRNYATDSRIVDLSRYEALNIGAEIHVPLIRDGEWRFSLVVFQQQAYDWRDDEIQLIQELASRIWAKLERARTEAALRESEEKYRTLFESIDQGFCVIEMLFDENSKPCDYRFLETNPAFEQQSGLVNVQGKRMREFAPNHEEYWFEIYGNVVLTGEPRRFENRAAALQRWYDVYGFRIGQPDERKVAVLFNDITERKQVEESLRLSEQRLKLALKTGKLGSWQLDLKTKELFTSEQCKVNYGVSLDADFSHQVLFNRIHPDDRAWVEAAVQQAIAQHSEYDVEYRTVWDDGTIHWALVRGTAIYDIDGTPLQMVGMSLDVTDRKQVEQALRESEEQSRNILESITDGFFAVDENWRFTYVNQAAEVLLNCTLGDLIGKILWEEYPGLAGSEFEQIYWGAMRDRVAGSVTAFYPDHERWYEAHIYPGATGITVYFRNVTAHIQAEAALRQSEERYRTLFESIDEGFCVVEVMVAPNNTPVDYRVLEINPVFEQQTGIQQAVGKTARELKLEDHWIEVYGRVALTGEPIRFESGSDVLGRWFDVYACRTGQPQERKVAIVFKDISARKQAEAEREQILQREQTAREAAERANQIKDEFLAVLSHELRSPLNPILGWTRLLQNGKLAPTRQTEALKTIERNAKLQTQLIEDLLDISRIMQGKLTLNAAPVSLTFVISAAVETVRLAAEAKHIAIALNLAPAVSSISGDAARLQQVVWNLLTNAVKFTPNGGQVTVELRQIDGLAQIRVIDTGKGINPQFLPHVFEYFRQEDGSTTRKFGGLGLGLAIVRQIVEMHGGTVKAESRGENQGATFIVQLPTALQVAPSVPEPTHIQTDLKAPLDNIQILLVDDEPDTREFQAFLLEQSGAKVTAVASGLEALQVLDRFIPDVLVSDLGMPDMDGYMLIEQIRSRLSHQGGAIVALALTAYAAEVDRIRAIEAGFQAFVTKPVEPETLVKAIISLLDGNQPEVEKISLSLE